MSAPLYDPHSAGVGNVGIDPLANVKGRDQMVPPLWAITSGLVQSSRPLVAEKT